MMMMMMMMTMTMTMTMMIGTLSNDDDGSKKLTKKMNLRPFKLYRVHLESLNSSIVGDFFLELNS